MKCDVIDLTNKKTGTIDLDENIFGIEVRRDLLARTVNWQLDKRRSGNHKVKERAEVNGTKSKPFNQKGTGRARQGTLRAPQMRTGGVVFGPHVRSHETKLPKQIRRLALKSALSAKKLEGKLVVLEKAKIDSPKTKELVKSVSEFDWGRALIIDGNKVDSKFAMAARNIKELDVLPCVGANVYDILRRDTLVLTVEAVTTLTDRLK
ncbi:MAG: 50S ribosomal protein L4 [Rhodospirillaceae bacterium TMED8]|nr:50S ribosomal protein L4 [Magnetovibrio sp.]OUT49573.1 MAG: 50S ribosomal protein L4 [Rhodospirillaceae bacterium TMED8]